MPAPCRRQDRGHYARHGYPLRCHLARARLARANLCPLYCARGQAENLIKMHKAQLTQRSHFVPISQREPDAADPAHRCLLAVVAHPAAVPKVAALATAEFATLRLQLLMVASPRHRDRLPYRGRLRFRLSRRRPVPDHRRRPQARPNITSVAVLLNVPTRSIKPASHRSQALKKTQRRPSACSPACCRQRLIVPGNNIVTSKTG